MFVRRALSAFALGLASLLASPAGTVRADEPAAAPGPAVARLLPPEVEILRHKFPDWDQKDAAERERIATNVLRLRNLSPEDRARVVERVKQAEAHGVLDHLRDRLDKMKDFRAKAVEGHLLARAVVSGVLRALPSEEHGVFQGGPQSLTPAQKAFVEQTLVAAWWKRATESLVASPPLDAQASSAASVQEAAAFVRFRDETAKAGGASAPVEKRRAYAAAFVRDRVHAILAAAPRDAAAGDPKARDAAVAAVTLAVRQTFPGVLDVLGRSVADAGKSGPEGLLQWGMEQEVGVIRSPEARMRRLADLLVDLERTLAVLGVSPELRAKIEEVQKQILVDLKVPDADARPVLDAKTPWERWRALQRLRQQFGARATGPEKGWPPFGPGRRGGPPPLPPAPPAAMDELPPMGDPANPK